MAVEALLPQFFHLWRFRVKSCFCSKAVSQLEVSILFAIVPFFCVWEFRVQPCFCSKAVSVFYKFIVVASIFCVWEFLV